MEGYLSRISENRSNIWFKKINFFEMMVSRKGKFEIISPLVFFVLIGIWSISICDAKFKRKGSGDFVSMKFCTMVRIFKSKLFLRKGLATIVGISDLRNIKLLRRFPAGRL